MKSDVQVLSFPNGEIQRIHVVHPENWQQLEFLHPAPAPEALDCFADIYRKYLVPACPWIFGNLVLFRLPAELSVPFSKTDRRFGTVSDDLSAAAAALRSGVSFLGGKPVFRSNTVRHFWQELERRDCIRLVRGKLPVTTILPVGNLSGFLTESNPDAALKVNASFFIMDPIDCATVYDRIGTPLGLCVRNGIVENPPLFLREALLVKTDGTVHIDKPDLRQLDIEIGGTRYRHGENARIYSRPDCAHTPANTAHALVISGHRVLAVHTGKTPVPASGFVLCPTEASTVQPGNPVTYHGMEDIQFGIQVGNSIVRDGIPTTAFLSRFYNIRKLERIPFPPSLYPMNFRQGRAARIALGADREGKPMILWAEGAGKLGYTPGIDSRGASLADMAEICQRVGMVQAVNLDGGGSAQLLLHNRRSLRISDRNPDNSESERPVPLGLMIR